MFVFYYLHFCIFLPDDSKHILQAYLRYTMSIIPVAINTASPTQMVAFTFIQHDY